MSEGDNLSRFIDAQAQSYAQALREIQAGQKRSHWIWYIFPQLRGLGQSVTAQHYGIGSIDEARAYLDHKLLGDRYRQCVEALMALSGDDPVVIFGAVDAMKLRSSLTLFEAARPLPLFGAALDRWFGGERDPMTLRLLAQ